MGALPITSAGLALALTVGVSAPVEAWDDDVDAQIAAAVETQPDVFLDSARIPEGQVDVTLGVVSAPASSAETLELVLPTDDLDTLAYAARSETGDFSVAVHDEGDGAFRALFHIPSADSPREYRFDVSDPFHLVPLEDGGITVRDASGQLAGVIAPPWATDSNGNPAATDYLIRGNSVIQRVHPSSSTVFPVVADPFWIPALMVFAHLTRHAVTQAAVRGVSQTLIKQVVQNGVKSAGQKGTSVFTQGSGVNRIRVVVDNKTGNIITVTKG